MLELETEKNSSEAEMQTNGIAFSEQENRWLSRFYEFDCCDICYICVSIAVVHSQINNFILIVSFTTIQITMEEVFNPA